MARPSKQNSVTIKKLEEAFLLGASLEEACFYANICEQTYYNWVGNDAQLLERFERLKMAPVLKARKSVVQALETNPELALKFLERKCKAEFGLKESISPLNSGGDIHIIIGEENDESPPTEKAQQGN